jgi:hypothetical protein
VHAHQDPLLLGTLLAALEGSLDVLIPVIASQGKANPAEDRLGVLGRRVVIAEMVVILWDS